MGRLVCKPSAISFIYTKNPDLKVTKLSKVMGHEALTCIAKDTEVQFILGSVYLVRDSV